MDEDKLRIEVEVDGSNTTSELSKIGNSLDNTRTRATETTVAIKQLQNQLNKGSRLSITINNDDAIQTTKSTIREVEQALEFAKRGFQIDLVVGNRAIVDTREQIAELEKMLNAFELKQREFESVRIKNKEKTVNKEIDLLNKEKNIMVQVNESIEKGNTLRESSFQRLENEFNRVQKQLKEMGIVSNNTQFFKNIGGFDNYAEQVRVSIGSVEKAYKRLDKAYLKYLNSLSEKPLSHAKWAENRDAILKETRFIEEAYSKASEFVKVKMEEMRSVSSFAGSSLHPSHEEYLKGTNDWAKKVANLNAAIKKLWIDYDSSLWASSAFTEKEFNNWIAKAEKLERKAKELGASWKPVQEDFYGDYFKKTYQHTQELEKSRGKAITLLNKYKLSLKGVALTEKELFSLTNKLVPLLNQIGSSLKNEGVLSNHAEYYKTTEEYIRRLASVEKDYLRVIEKVNRQKAQGVMLTEKEYLAALGGLDKHSTKFANIGGDITKLPTLPPLAEINQEAMARRREQFQDVFNNIMNGSSTYQSQLKQLRRLHEEVTNASKTDIANKARYETMLNSITGALSRTNTEMKKYENTLVSANAKSSKFLDSVKGHMRWMASSIAMAAPIAIVHTFTEDLKEIEKSYATILQVVPKLEEYKEKAETSKTSEMRAYYEQLSNKGLQNQIDIATKYGLGAQEVIEGAGSIGRMYGQGENGQQNTEILSEQAAKIAVADNFEIKEAVKGLEAVMSQFKLNTENPDQLAANSSHAIDVITLAAHRGAASAKDIFGGIERSGSTAYQNGMSLEFLTSLIETGVRTTGRSGNEIGNAIKSVITTMRSAKSEKALKEELGVDVYEYNKDGTKSFKSMEKLFLEVAQALKESKKDNSRLLTTLSGGKYQVSVLTGLLGDPKEIQRMQRLLTSSEVNGITDRQVKIQMETLGRKLQQLKTATLDLMNSINNAGAGDFLKNLVQSLTTCVKLTKHFVSEWKDVLGIVVRVGVAIKTTQFINGTIAKMAQFVGQWRGSAANGKPKERRPQFKELIKNKYAQGFGDGYASGPVREQMAAENELNKARQENLGTTKQVEVAEGNLGKTRLASTVATEEQTAQTKINSQAVREMAMANAEAMFSMSSYTYETRAAIIADRERALSMDPIVKGTNKFARGLNSVLLNLRPTSIALRLNKAELAALGRVTEATTRKTKIANVAWKTAAYTCRGLSGAFRLVSASAKAFYVAVGGPVGLAITGLTMFLPEIIEYFGGLSDKIDDSRSALERLQESESKYTDMAKEQADASERKIAIIEDSIDKYERLRQELSKLSPETAEYSAKEKELAKEKQHLTSVVGDGIKVFEEDGSIRKDLISEVYKRESIYNLAKLQMIKAEMVADKKKTEEELSNTEARLQAMESEGKKISWLSRFKLISIGLSAGFDSPSYQLAVKAAQEGVEDPEYEKNVTELKNKVITLRNTTTFEDEAIRTIDEQISRMNEKLKDPNAKWTKVDGVYTPSKNTVSHNDKTVDDTNDSTTGSTQKGKTSGTRGNTVTPKYTEAEMQEKVKELEQKYRDSSFLANQRYNEHPTAGLGFDGDTIPFTGNAQADKVATRAAQALAKRGMNTTQIAAILGNWSVESGGFNPSAIGDNGTSIGLMQWHAGRAEALKRFAAQQGKNYKDVETQVDYFIHEITNTSERANWQKTSKAVGVRDMSRAFTINNERPADSIGQANYRAGISERYYNLLNNHPITRGVDKSLANQEDALKAILRDGLKIDEDTLNSMGNTIWDIATSLGKKGYNINHASANAKLGDIVFDKNNIAYMITNEKGAYQGLGNHSDLKGEDYHKLNLTAQFASISRFLESQKVTAANIDSYLKKVQLPKEMEDFYNYHISRDKNRFYKDNEDYAEGDKIRAARAKEAQYWKKKEGEYSSKAFQLLKQNVDERLKQETEYYDLITKRKQVLESTIDGIFSEGFLKKKLQEEGFSNWRELSKATLDELVNKYTAAIKDKSLQTEITMYRGLIEQIRTTAEKQREAELDRNSFYSIPNDPKNPTSEYELKKKDQARDKEMAMAEYSAKHKGVTDGFEDSYMKTEKRSLEKLLEIAKERFATELSEAQANAEIIKRDAENTIAEKSSQLDKYKGEIEEISEKLDKLESLPSPTEEDLSKIRQYKEELTNAKQNAEQTQKDIDIETEKKINAENTVKEVIIRNKKEIGEIEKKLYSEELEIRKKGKALTEQAITDFLSGTKRASAALKDLYKSLVKMLAQMAMQKLASRWANTIWGFSSGGDTKVPSRDVAGTIPWMGGKFADGGSIVDGGLIRGAGTGTSDSILAYLQDQGKFIMVSNGEYIMNEQATKKHRGILEKMNLGKFASGGSIAPEPYIPVLRNPTVGEATLQREAQKQSNTSKIEQLLQAQLEILEQLKNKPTGNNNSGVTVLNTNASKEEVFGILASNPKELSQILGSNTRNGFM